MHEDCLLVLNHGFRLSFTYFSLTCLTYRQSDSPFTSTPLTGYQIPYYEEADALTMYKVLYAYALSPLSHPLFLFPLPHLFFCPFPPPFFGSHLWRRSYIPTHLTDSCLIRMIYCGMICGGICGGEEGWHMVHSACINHLIGVGAFSLFTT